MKAINFILLLFLVGMFSCKKTEIDALTEQRAGWTTINLNVDYTIQFPPETYHGKSYRLREEVPGQFGDRGTGIWRNDSTYNLITATYCHPGAYPCSLLQYGDTLQLPWPKSISSTLVTGQSGKTVQRISFGRKNAILAALYYTENPDPEPFKYQGRLYLISRKSGLPQNAGSARFNEATKQEIFDILTTIAPR